jgi:hypothetical protein
MHRLRAVELALPDPVTLLYPELSDDRGDWTTLCLGESANFPETRAVIAAPRGGKRELDVTRLPKRRTRRARQGWAHSASALPRGRVPHSSCHGGARGHGRPRSPRHVHTTCEPGNLRELLPKKDSSPYRRKSATGARGGGRRHTQGEEVPRGRSEVRPQATAFDGRPASKASMLSITCRQHACMASWLAHPT